MTKIAFVADLHVANHKMHGGPVVAGLNTRCRLVLKALAAACVRANELGCGALVVAGDVFDYTTPEPQVIAATSEAMACFDGHVYLMVGNHDQVSAAPGDHALGPLARAGSVTVVERPQHVRFAGVNLFLVPFYPGAAAQDYLADALAWDKEAPRPPGNSVLCTHLGITDEDTAFFLRDARNAMPADVLRNLGFSAVFSGDWHSRAQWYDGSVMQVGALAPTGWDNPGVDGYGTLAVYDSEFSGEERAVSWEVVPGPRFLVGPQDEEELRRLRDAGCTVFVRLKADADSTPMALAWLQDAKEKGLVHAGEARMDDAAVSEQASSAARAARSATTLEDAVTRFCAEVGLAPDVDREEVTTRVRRYLGL